MSATHERDSQTAPQKERNCIRLRLSWCSTSALLWREYGDTRIIDNSGKKKRISRLLKHAQVQAQSPVVLTSFQLSD